MPRRARAAFPAQEAGPGHSSSSSRSPPAPPGLSRCPGLTPSSGGHRGAFFPPKIKQSPLPGAASSEPLRDGRLAWASPRRCCGAHRDSPPRSCRCPSRPHQCPQAALQRFGVLVFVCQGRRGLGGIRRAVPAQPRSRPARIVGSSITP